jgi:tetratricopeptide (TPR) repeat protein
MSDDDVAGNFAGWLYRPLVDLGDWQVDGNPALLGVQLAAQALSTGRDDVVRLHGMFYPSAREALLRTAHLDRYLVRDPADLARELRTPAWQDLCDHLGAYPDLDVNARIRTAWLLHRLTLHEALLDYVERPCQLAGGRLDDGGAALLYLRGLAQIVLFSEGLGDLEPAEAEAVEALARPGSWGHVEATYTLAQLRVKVLGDTAGFLRHLDNHAASIEASGAEGHERNKLLSRYHRLKAFAPQLSGDLDGMTGEMDLAERHCDLMSRADSGSKAEWEALRAALLQSRVKEMLVRGEYDRAEEYALALNAHSPADYRGLECVGQVRIEKQDFEGALEAYRQACILGPHATATLEFMAGQCHEKLGRTADARDAYLRSLGDDPLAISSAERLDEIMRDGQPAHLRIWASRHLRYLQALDDQPDGLELQEYQKYSGTLGRG